MSSVVIVPSKSNPFVDYVVSPETGKCSCPARPGKCWYLKVARWTRDFGVTVDEILRRLRKAKALGGCGRCKWCAKQNGYPCPASPAGRAAWSRMVINSEIERTI